MHLSLCACYSCLLFLEMDEVWYRNVHVWGREEKGERDESMLKEKVKVITYQYFLILFKLTLHVTWNWSLIDASDCLIMMSSTVSWQRCLPMWKPGSGA